jgi:hypothetical protein
MGENQISEKLYKKLGTPPKLEEDVVYILSRIRKILEIHDYPERYDVLNFYCNLALHSRIDRFPKRVADMLRRAQEGKDYSESIVGFGDLRKQLISFSEEYKFPNLYDHCKEGDFNKLLIDIYSETPITFKAVEYEIHIDENGRIRGGPIR